MTQSLRQSAPEIVAGLSQYLVFTVSHLDGFLLLLSARHRSGNQVARQLVNIHTTNHADGAGVEGAVVGILGGVAAAGVLGVEKQIAVFGHIGARNFRAERNGCQAGQTGGHQAGANAVFSVCTVLAISAVGSISAILTVVSGLPIGAILSIAAVLTIGTGFALGASLTSRTLLAIIAAAGGESGNHGDQGQQLSFFTQLENHCVAPVIYGVVFEYGARSLSVGKVMLWRTHKR